MTLDLVCLAPVKFAPLRGCLPCTPCIQRIAACYASILPWQVGGWDLAPPSIVMAWPTVIHGGCMGWSSLNQAGKPWGWGRTLDVAYQIHPTQSIQIKVCLGSSTDPSDYVVGIMIRLLADCSKLVATNLRNGAHWATKQPGDSTQSGATSRLDVVLSV